MCCGHGCSFDCHPRLCVPVFPNLFQVEHRSDPALFVLLRGALLLVARSELPGMSGHLRPHLDKPRAEGPISNQHNEKLAQAQESGGSLCLIYVIFCVHSIFNKPNFFKLTLNPQKQILEIMKTFEDTSKAYKRGVDVFKNKSLY